MAKGDWANTATNFRTNKRLVVKPLTKGEVKKKEMKNNKYFNARRDYRKDLMGFYILETNLNASSTAARRMGNV